MTDLSKLPKKITLRTSSFFELMSMVQQCQYYDYEVADWDKYHHTFLGFITRIDYTIIMERRKYNGETNDGLPLDIKLANALQSENYEEAARLRDLINKK